MCDLCCIACHSNRPKDICVALWCSKTASHCLSVRCSRNSHYSRGGGGGISQEEPQKTIYDEQVLIQYQGAREPAKNLKYKLVGRDSKTVLKEGKTDEKGKTERITTEKAEAVEVFVIRLDSDKKYSERKVGYFWTNDRKDSVHVIQVLRGRIFFDIRYVHPTKDAAQSFIKAAETLQRDAQGLVDKYRGDVWWSFDVTCEEDIKIKWKELKELQEEADREIKRGHILTHASIDGKAGLDFEVREVFGCSSKEDGTLDYTEIRNLPELRWSSSSQLIIHSCRSGLPAPSQSNKTIADAFFEGQSSLKYVEAMKGRSYFSYNPKTYVEIKSNVNDMANIYLLAFNRMRNVSDTNAALTKYVSPGWEKGDLSALPTYTRMRP